MERLTRWAAAALAGWFAVRSVRAHEEVALLAADDAGRIQHAEGSQRGRTADHPREIPRRGWKDILVRTYRGITEDRVMRVSAGVTYYVLMAIFPGLFALVSIYGLIANPDVIEQQVSGLAGTIPQEAITIIQDQLEHLASQDQRALGFAFLGSLLVSLWTANAAIKALFDALNVVYGEKERRNFIKLNAMSLLFTAGMILFLMLAMTGIVVVPAVLAFLDLGGAGPRIISLLRWPALLAIVIFALAVLYRHGPYRANARWRWITWGSVAAAILWLLVSMLFSWYTGNFGNYNKTYGSLGAVIAFMVWIWLSTTVVLMGGKLNAEIEHQTAKDSTTGRPQPLGRRGARMADTVGPPQD